MNSKNIAAYLTLIILLLISIFGYVYYYIKIKIPLKNYNIKEEKSDNNSTCNVKMCNSIDPVSDPKYNMQQIIKQSILLEEHLANKNKRCRDCITKHFSHIIGLAEEAQMLAANNISKYPLINEAAELYNNLFKEWLADNGKFLEICGELRNMRKKLIAVYFFDEDYDIDGEDNI